MDTWLKMLITSACVVIIGGGGYLASLEYDAKYSRDAQVNALLERNKETMRRLGEN
ncbi:hypothetical protein GOB42_15125 [Sinorhizobium meliloti]|uniref:hypothetical protein n=1 Tax=Rhizobium meliloti TaxID=382 RepID=UPI0013E323FB|nr:hypothetical protein [Sinorhizobium meliloti]MDW9792116.1 hypothetical protein [Sinorhizobium meliloti]